MVELLLLLLLLVLMLPIRNSVIKKVWTLLPLKRQDQLRLLILLVTNSVKLLLLLLLLLIMFSLVLVVLPLPLLQQLLEQRRLVPVPFLVQSSPLDFHFWPFWLHSGSDSIHAHIFFYFIQDILDK